MRKKNFFFSFDATGLLNLGYGFELFWAPNAVKWHEYTLTDSRVIRKHVFFLHSQIRDHLTTFTFGSTMIKQKAMIGCLIAFWFLALLIPSIDVIVMLSNEGLPTSSLQWQVPIQIEFCKHHWHSPR